MIVCDGSEKSTAASIQVGQQGNIVRQDGVGRIATMIQGYRFQFHVAASQSFHSRFIPWSVKKRCIKQLQSRD
jgi:hypothetical protein